MKKFKTFRLICTWVALVWVLLELFWLTPPWGRFRAEYDSETNILVVSGWFKQSVAPFVSSCPGPTHINWIHIMVERKGDYQTLDSGWLGPLPPIRRYRRTFFLSGKVVDSVAVTLGAGSGTWCSSSVRGWDIPVP